MKNSILILVVVLVLFFFGATKLGSQNLDPVMEEVKELSKEVAMEPASKGVYTQYDESLLASEGKVVIFFKANWCPTCIALDKDIVANEIPEDIAILKVDYDTAKDLKQKYGVTTQHTLVQVDASGNEITKWVGSNTLEQLLANLK